MKNIHVLPTKGLSRLVKGETTGRLLLHDIYGTSTDRNETQNIYITSDEEIKVGDWVYSEARNTLFKVKSKATTSVGTLLIEDDVIMPLEINEIDCKKIILTTDLDLIKDGVWGIEDGFLEWFVKNPTCEYVELKGYAIILPRESCDCDKMCSECEPKQETTADYIDRHIVEAMVEVAKQKMYSEEDMVEAIRFGFDKGFCSNSSNKAENLGLSEQEWFEQFKNK